MRESNPPLPLTHARPCCPPVFPNSCRGENNRTGSWDAPLTNQENTESAPPSTLFSLSINACCQTKRRADSRLSDLEPASSFRPAPGLESHRKTLGHLNVRSGWRLFCIELASPFVLNHRQMSGTSARSGDFLDYLGCGTEYLLEIRSWQTSNH